MWTYVQMVCVIFPGVARTVYHGPQTGGFNYRHGLSPSSGHEKAKSKACAGLAPPEASPPGPHALPASSQGRSSVRVCVMTPSFHADTGGIGSGPTPMT